MATKSKMKVVTEEIKEEKVREKENETQETQDITQPEEKTPAEVSTKLTSFSTLDVSDSENTKLESAVDSSTTQGDIEVKLEDNPNESSQSSSTPQSEVPAQMSSDDVKNWLNDVRPDTSKEMEKGGKSGFKVFLIAILLLIAVGLAAGGFYYYKNNSSTTETKQEETMTQTTPTQTTTPEPTKSSVDLKNYSLNVLNGSGVSGEAKKVSDMLVTAGFNESKTGNASKTDFTKTEVSLKKDTPNEVFNVINETLGKSYDVVKAEKELDDKSTYDVVVTVGTKKSS